MVARAIMHRPAILFLDEPTAGLDPQSRIALWEILGELHADGQTILLTTHYMEEADQLCDRLAIIDHGQLLALDTPAELKQLDRRRHHRHRHRRRRPRRARRACSTPRSPGVQQRRRASTAPCVVERAGRSTASLPAVVRRRRAPRLRRHRPLGHRADARDRLHQPHREGPPRMTAVTDPRRAADRARRRPASRVGRGTRRVPRAAAPRPRRAAQDAQGVHPPHDAPAVPARVRVHLRVPEDRAGRRRQRRGASRVLDRCSSPASSASRSCSRASSRSRCRWCRSSGTRARSRTACSRRCRSSLVAIEKVDRRAR